MYKIIGVDGKKYGPIELEQLRRWLAEGRINAQTRVLLIGASEWKPASQFPELGFAAATGVPGTGPSAPPPRLAPSQAPAPAQGLAVTSFVLGLLSVVCFGFLTGIPAVICGHLA